MPSAPAARWAVLAVGAVLALGVVALRVGLGTYRPHRNEFTSSAHRSGAMVWKAWSSGREGAAANASVAASSACSDWTSHGDDMECGANVPLCGLLTLQTGLGTGVYHHNKPMVHGLWPEVGSYGSSKCIKPEDPTPPSTVYPCYADPDEPDTLGFEQHEWEKHGECAGAKDQSDYFDQVCRLSTAPLAALRKARDAGQDFNAMADSLQSAGFCVFSLSTYEKQIMLSACAGADRRWKLADVSDFSRVCGSGGPSPGPSPSPSPPPSPKPGACVTGHHGPPCKSNADCDGVKDCVRCAKSGFCTDVPIEGQGSFEAAAV
mmetsp:Transcript_114478/g.296610  ORF Transcript_114478/g.296610 Transcript_114478/m.296610 type:complete len:319 (+) Transcript_114478:82-1038(+)